MIFRWLRAAIRFLEEYFFAWFVPLRARRELCDTLLEIGVPARLAKGRQPEEEYGSGRYAGLINIGDGPIRWININIVPGGVDYPGRYVIEYGVPDSRDLPEVSISAVFARTLPAIGRITAVRWEGKDGGLGILGRLNRDASLGESVMEKQCDLTIRSRPKHGCWLIVNHWPALSARLWSCYQKIAGHLLAEWPRGGD